MSHHYIQKLLFVSIALACSTTTLHAAGFALANQSGSGTGNAYAGVAATADDASVIWFNPAGMTELPTGTHTAIAGHIIAPKAKFTNNGSTNPPALGSTPLSGKNDDGGKTGVIPNAYLVKGKGQKWRFGVGINAPFGLGTKYDEDWVGRYHTLESNIQTINFNPSIAYKVNDKLSVGAGISVQKMEVELISAVRVGAFGDGKIKIKGDSTEQGYNVGMLFKPTSRTKVGVSYRSRMTHQLEGDVNSTIPSTVPDALKPAVQATLPTGAVIAEADLPSNFSLSVAHQLNQRLELLGDITRTRWSSFDTLKIARTNGTTLTEQPQSWKDVNRYSIGANYQYSDRLKLKAGLAYDQTPVPSVELRSPRTPDSNRTWVSLGANYKSRKNFSVDVGYTHIFTNGADINNKNNLNSNVAYTIKGSYDSSINILSTQLNWSF